MNASMVFSTTSRSMPVLLMAATKFRLGHTRPFLFWGCEDSIPFDTSNASLSLDVKSFVVQPKLLLPWYHENHRALPWRETKDPYRIWLSEVMLQQTRVDQGLGYYLRFTQRWPTVEKLAAAHENEVLKEWQGLGYYSRARNLLKAAQQVVVGARRKVPR
jgi:adenine-specific DNA glycosylase